MDLPENPYPISDKGITQELFVGRKDILEAFDSFLRSPPSTGANEFWIVSGTRGQGKTTLRQELRRRAKQDPRTACGDLDWVRPPPGTAQLAHGLYASIAEPDGPLPGPVTDAARWRFKARKWLPDLSVDLKFLRWSIPKYAERFRNADGLVRELSSNLLPEKSNVVLLIDEVSDSEPFVEPTRAFAKALSNHESRHGARRLNFLTIVFVQPHHKDRFSPKLDGPRSNTPFELNDFGLSEVHHLVKVGMASAAKSGQPGADRVTADLDKVAQEVRLLAGGVPTLTLGLLRDAYAHMARRLQGAADGMPSLGVDDVRGYAGLGSSEVAKRLAMFENLVLDDADVHRKKVDELKAALAKGDFGSGPWGIEDLKKAMEGLIGKASDKPRTLLLAALEKQGYIRVDKTAGQVAFRGDILRLRLASVKTA